MTLEKYRSKRFVERTPEPAGLEPAQAGTGETFVVQEHSARRHHFDLRLSTEGVLRSWAVPKGPSMKPGDRRLAVMVEDHPLEYADFEGIIPEGNYGAGAVIVWDRGEYRVVDPPGGDAAEALRKGKLGFELHGFKLRGAFTLVRTRLGREAGATRDKNWLLIKQRDAHASDEDVAALHPRSVLSGLTIDEMREAPAIAAAVIEELKRADAPPSAGALEAKKLPLSLAKLAKNPFDGAGWYFEIKYDGVRALAVRDDGGVRLYGRNGVEITARYPEVALALRALPFERFAVDGEVVALDANGRPNFQLLQCRMHVQSAASVRRLSLSIPVTYFVFDLLMFDGFDLRPLALEVRKRLLAKCVRGEGPVRYCEHYPTHGRKFFEAAVELGLEGIMAKKRDSPYRGTRTGDWLKIKSPLTRRFVVGGYTDPAGSRVYFGALLLGLYEADGSLRFVGKVGTGFSDECLADLAQRMSARPQARSPFRPPTSKERSIRRGVHFCRPDLVAEVRFAEVTNDGCARQPSFIRLVENADPRQCKVEPPFLPRADKFALGAAALAERASSLGEPDGPPPRVRITHPDKVFWPAEGYTKADLVHYYQAVARWMLPYLENRPIVITRYPDGIEGKSFFQKDAPPSLPEWIRSTKIYSEDSKRYISFLLLDSPEALAYVANMGAIPIHIWSSSLPHPERPDWLLFDVDPKGSTTERAAQVAHQLMEVLAKLGLRPVVKTSGQAGFHVAVGLKPVYTYEQARRFCELVSRLVASRMAEVATTERATGSRKGRVYIDFLQLGYGKTIAAPFAARPLPGAPVSAPLKPAELRPGIDPRKYSIATMARRMSRLGTDPFLGALKDRQGLEDALARLEPELKEHHLLA